MAASTTAARDVARGDVRRTWIGACVLTGIGVYCTRAVLDIAGSGGAVSRIAMLPPWWELAALVVAFAGAALVAARARVDADVALPLVALGLLALPYTPWLPDKLPVVRALAGPARGWLWLVAIWAVAVLAARRLPSPGARVASMGVILVVSAAAFGAAALKLSRSGLFPGGDEPHYLVITQSILRDGDLRIENNHQRGDYLAYFDRPLKPDYLTRGKDGQIYSIHPVGMPILAVPAFAIGGYHAVMAMMVLLAATAAAIAWRWTREVTGSAPAATFGWCAAGLTAPFLFNSFTIYPEIPGALAVLVAIAWKPESTGTAVMVVRGLAIGALPWLSTKYAPMAAVAAVVVFVRTRFSMRAIVPLVVAAAVLVAAWFAFFYWIWGTFSPSAPYGASEPMTFDFLAHGGPGLLFDQEYGIVAYAPVLTLAFVGLWQMLRAGGAPARRAQELIVVFLALLATVGAFRLWWGGTAVPGRPVASGVLLLSVPIGWAFASTSSRPALRGVCHLLLASSVAIAITLAAAQGGTLLFNNRDGASALLEWVSPTWQLTAVFPSFITGSVVAAAGRSLLWLGGIGVVAIVAARVSPRAFGAATLVAVVTGSIGIVAVATAMRPASAAADPDPAARSRVPLLDEFDSIRRPLALIYDPLSRGSVADVLARVVLLARPGMRGEPQPLPLLWNARFSLPAGEYTWQLTRTGESSHVPARVGLQIGRVGPPLEEWTLTQPLTAQRVSLPLDAPLVGLRAMSDAGLSDGELRIVPVHVIDQSRRIARPGVISTYRYGAMTAYFHDDFSPGEPNGFWTRGRGTTQVTFVTDPSGPAALPVAVNCGPIPNRVAIRAGDSVERLIVEPGGTRQVSITTTVQPAVGVRVAAVDITADDGFVPADVDRASKDRRRLGCRMELTP